MSARYNFQTHISGTTFRGVDFFISDSDENAIDITGCHILMQLFFNNANGNKNKEFDNDQIGGIEIVNGEEGIFRFNKQIIDLRPGTYWHEIQFTYPSGDIFIYINGFWEIEKNGK